MHFEFATATRIIFGNGVFNQAGELAARLGNLPLIITGGFPLSSHLILDATAAQFPDFLFLSVTGEPEVDLVIKFTEKAREKKCNLVIAFGGGSVIDTGKAIAVLLANEGNLLDYLEVIGSGKSLSRTSIPFIAIPTTAGTGSEVTSNAVLESPPHNVKVSLRSPLMFPRIALVDPELTITLPPGITACTGLDALTQVIEPYVSNKANIMTDIICLEGIRRAGRSLLRACENGNDMEARLDMSFASLLGGMALSNAKLGAVHGFAGPLGGMFRAAHGSLCAALLPHVMEVNVRALRERFPESKTLIRYDAIARTLLGNEKARANDGISFIRDLINTLKIPGLKRYGVKKEDFPRIIEKASVSSSIQGNPIKLTHDEMEEILAKSL